MTALKVSDGQLSEHTAVGHAWAQVAEFCALAASLARRAADGDVEAGKKAAETLSFTQRCAGAAAGFGVGWSPERVMVEVAAALERAQEKEVERHKAMLKAQREALQVNWEQVEKLKDGVHTVAEFCATFRVKP